MGEFEDCVRCLKGQAPLSSISVLNKAGTTVSAEQIEMGAI